MPSHHTPGVRKLTINGLCEEVVQRYTRRPTHRYCFLLGAGASVASGIPSGETLAKQWLIETHRRECFTGQTLAEWSKQKFGTEFNPDRPGERYSEIYDLRFGHDRNDGYAHLETLMEGREPSIGYSYLGYILSETRHNVAITTNFDNLIADSVAIYGQKFPIVLADDSLAYYATTELRRPLIAKIHGGLGFAPKNSAADIGKLPEQWASALKQIFDNYEPIVVGYAGNDGSLMDLLQAIDPKTLHWCLRTSPENLDKAIAELPQRVKKLTERHSVNFVPIQGFDHLMAALWNGLAVAQPADFPDLLDALKRKQVARVEAHEKQRWEICGGDSLRSLSGVTEHGTSVALNLAKVHKKTGVFDSLKALVGVEGARREQKPWWQTTAEIDQMSDPYMKEIAYKTAIEESPLSVPLLRHYADLLTDVFKRHDDAEIYFRRALRLDPKHEVVVGRYAIFLTNVRRRFDLAEEYYCRALELNPNHAVNLINYAAFLANAVQRVHEAETYYRRGIKLDPKSAHGLGNFAQYLLLSGRNAEGLSKLSSAENCGSLRPSLAVELAFYRYAHDFDQRSAALRRLKALVSLGARSPGWNLARNTEEAQRDGHPNVQLLKALDAVVTRGEDVAPLDAFPEWREA